MLRAKAQARQDTGKPRRKNGPRKLIPFVLDSNVSQENSGRVGLPLQLPAQFLSHRAVRSITADQILSVIAFGFSTGVLDLYLGSVAVLSEALDSTFEQDLGLACGLHAFEQQPLGLVLGQNQDAVGGRDFSESAEIQLKCGMRPSGNPYLHVAAKFPCPDEAVVN